MPKYLEEDDDFNPYREDRESARRESDDRDDVSRWKHHRHRRSPSPTSRKYETNIRTVSSEERSDYEAARIRHRSLESDKEERPAPGFGPRPLLNVITNYVDAPSLYQDQRRRRLDEDRESFKGKRKVARKQVEHHTGRHSNPTRSNRVAEEDRRRDASVEEMDHFYKDRRPRKYTEEGKVDRRALEKKAEDRGETGDGRSRAFADD